MIQTLFGSVQQEPNLLERLKAGIQKTREGLVDRLEDAIAGRKEIDAAVLEELEYALITADIGVNTTSEILESIRQRVDRKQVGDAQQVKQLIAQHLLEVLEATERPVPRVAEPPAVVPRRQFRRRRGRDAAPRLFRRSLSQAQPRLGQHHDAAAHRRHRGGLGL